MGFLEEEPERDVRQPDTRYRILTNRLLAGPEPGTGLAEARALVEATRLGGLAGGEGFGNLGTIDLQMVEAVHDLYGEPGLFRLIFLATSQGKADFDHHRDLLLPWWHRLQTRAVDLSLDNESLPAGPELDAFNWNVLQPSLARKLYNAGTHHGYITYGLGGPRILVSLPFRGVSGEVYDFYNHSSDVVTSLIWAGYTGRFLLLDLLPGLNREIASTPAWLLWFSVVASHSDLVLFVHEQGTELTEFQRMESRYVPDLVQKKVVTLGAGELTWARTYQDVPPTVMRIGHGRLMSEEEWYDEEASVALPLIEGFVGDYGVPRDRLLVRAEDGEWSAFPLDYPVYG